MGNLINPYRFGTPTPSPGITFVGGKSYSWGASVSLDFTSLTGGLASAPSQDDFYIISIAVGTTSTNEYLQTYPSGCNLDQVLLGNDSNPSRLRTYYGFIPSGSLPTGQLLTTGASASAIIQCFRGVDLTTPFDVAVQTATGINDAQTNPPAITPITAGARIVCAGACGHAGSTNFTDPSDLTDITKRLGSNQTDDCAGMMASKTDWVSGAFDPATWGGHVTTTSSSYAAVTYALRPA